MLDKIEIRTRGVVGRDMEKTMRNAVAESWMDVGREFAIKFIPKRFTPAHAIEAEYQPRAGQRKPRGSKEFWGSYFGRKLKKTGSADPFVYSGESRRAARTAFITSTSKGAAVRLKLPHLVQGRSIKYLKDFVKITAQERPVLAEMYDRFLDARLAAIQSNSTTTIS